MLDVPFDELPAVIPGGRVLLVCQRNSGFDGQYGVERGTGDSALYLPETYCFQQAAVLQQCPFLTLGADQHVQGLQLG